jgi:hypothetical protein
MKLTMRTATIKQVYVPYWKWEDYINGMWRKVPKEQELAMLIKAIEFTGNHIKYGSAMLEVSKKWPKTMLNSLTNQSINRRAFIGHCAVQYKIGIPEYITRMAWKELTDKQRFLADDIAEKTIKHYLNETRNSRLHKNLGKQMLFEWPTR